MKRHLNVRKLIVVAMTLVLLLFAVLSVYVAFHPAIFIDLEFSREVQEYRNPFLDALMKGISWFGYMPQSMGLVCFAALVFFILKFKREAFFLLLTLLSGVINSGIKILVNRPRPAASAVQIIEKASHQSFPSGHVVFYLVFFGMLTLIMYRNKNFSRWVRIVIPVLSLFLILSVPLSRVYLGDHWLTDVSGGFLIGMFLLAVLAFFYFDKRERRG